MRVLLVADSDSIDFPIGDFTIEHAADVAEMLDFLETYTFDVVALVNPIVKTVVEIRTRKVGAAILVVSDSNAVPYLDAGADDVVRTWAPAGELASRIRALVRRTNGRPDSSLSVGGLAIDLNTKRAKVYDQEFRPTGKEYAVLELLMLRRGSIVTKEHILAYLYNGMDEPEVKIIDVFVCKIRKKLVVAGIPDLIETVWGRGYMIRDDQEAASPSLVPSIAEMVGV